MMTQEEILTVLLERLPDSVPRSLLETVAREIVTREADWEELTPGIEPELGYHIAVQCSDICPLAEMAQAGVVFRIFRKREEAADAVTPPGIPQKEGGRS